MTLNEVPCFNAHPFDISTLERAVRARVASDATKLPLHKCCGEALHPESKCIAEAPFLSFAARSYAFPLALLLR